ncbi:MAG TPA: LLM class flavin-dependent oxidoreductase, partial [Acidimicrobiales bacterium]|nr:LLM class flavin-dependent oxidoreductase [Acidimicrobiales bacterium]
MRFDLRAPGPTPPADLYAAALDMAEWGEQHGALAVVLSQHHASDDGYLPSPTVMAAAIAARTSTVPISIAALLLLMYDPVKLAEDLNVLDHLSRGRVSPTIGLGYRPEEFAMFGIDPAARGAEMEERLAVLQRLLAGEEVEWRGRTASVRPLPYTEGGMRLSYGGGTPAAARRAARFGLDFVGEA